MAKSPKSEAANPAFVLLHGGDEYTLAEKSRELVARLVGDQPMGDVLEALDGTCGTIGEVETLVSRAVSALMTVSMFNPLKVVWLKGVNWLPEKALSRFDGVKSQIERLQKLIEKGLPAGTHLVITSDAVSARSAFLKAAQKAGEVHEHDLADKPWELEPQMIRLASEQLRARGVSWEEGVPELMIERLGFDPRLVHSEVEKLDLFLGERRTLTEEDVHLMVPIVREVAPWDLADAIAQHNLTLAFSRLEQLLHQKINEVAIMSSLANRLREISLYRECLDKGYAAVTGNGRFAKVTWKDDHAHQLVHACIGGKTRKSPFAETQGFQSALHYNARELGRARQIVADAWEQLFSTGLGKQQLFELLILKILGASSRG